MANYKIKQFVFNNYYYNKEIDGQIETVYPNHIVSGQEILKENDLNITKVVRLGIQTVPNVKFKINANGMSTIKIGRTGIYQIDLSSLGYISSLSVEDQNSVENINNNYCYIDIVYEE